MQQSHDGTPGEETGRREGEIPGTQELTSVSKGCSRMVHLEGDFVGGLFSHTKSRNVYSGSQTLDPHDPCTPASMSVLASFPGPRLRYRPLAHDIIILRIRTSTDGYSSMAAVLRSRR